MRVASLVCFISCMLISIRLSTGSICYDTGNFTTNSTYEKNRDLILSSLVSDVTVRDGLYYNTTIGQGEDKVYALVNCRGDSSAQDCADCISNIAIPDMIDTCPNQKEVVAWGGSPQCIVRYSNRSIFGKMEIDPMAGGCSQDSIATNITQYDQTWDSLMDRLLRKASTGSPGCKFATGSANLTSFVTIYALMQCTPDISQSDCDKCLRESVAFTHGHYHAKTGALIMRNTSALIMRPSCMYISDLSPFYEVTSYDLSQSPPIAPNVPHSPSNNSTKTEGKGDNKSRTVLIIVVSTVISVVLLVVAFVYVVLLRRKSKQGIRNKQETEDVDEIDNVEFLQFDFNTIRTATNEFSIDSRLGQGGFGVVYKGRLPDGRDIAVKRLSMDSGQGELEFKNEVLLVAKLQHRNLVRLLGFCLKENERLLIYEFMPNSSLDNFIFDPVKRSLLDWKARYKIIGGIARGVLYLHEDSRFRIIHRDLKASNILLDIDMIPKISDFGMARLFEMDQTQCDTSRVVGTFGYMAPDYVKHGNFSIKSDVFSFGMLVLEIISGQKNSSFHNGEQEEDLLAYAWRNWNEGTALNVIDPILKDGSNSEMMRCIHICLLCVQENPANRPTMATIVLMLTSNSISIPVPSKPAFFMHNSSRQHDSELPLLYQSKDNVQFSINEVSITEPEPR